MATDLKDHLFKELQSFKTPPPKQVAPLPKEGDLAPRHEKLILPEDKPAIIIFLRHCGCPFAEKSFRSLVAFSTRHSGAIACTAVSHSSAEATERWVAEVGGAWETDVVIDEDRDVYAAWGLGLSSYWHALSPWGVLGAVRLGKSEGIWNRTVESGSKWQTAGAFAIDRRGLVRWVSVARVASDVPDLDAALRALIEVPTEVPAQATTKVIISDLEENPADSGVVGPNGTSMEDFHGGAVEKTMVQPIEPAVTPVELVEKPVEKPMALGKELPQLPVEEPADPISKVLPDLPTEVPLESPREMPAERQMDSPIEPSSGEPISVASEVSRDFSPVKPAEEPSEQSCMDHYGQQASQPSSGLSGEPEMIQAAELVHDTTTNTPHEPAAALSEDKVAVSDEESFKEPVELSSREKVEEPAQDSITRPPEQPAGVPFEDSDIELVEEASKATSRSVSDDTFEDSDDDSIEVFVENAVPQILVRPFEEPVEAEPQQEAQQAVQAPSEDSASGPSEVPVEQAASPTAEEPFASHNDQPAVSSIETSAEHPVAASFEESDDESIKDRPETAPQPTHTEEPQEDSRPEEISEAAPLPSAHRSEESFEKADEEAYEQAENREAEQAESLSSESDYDDFEDTAEHVLEKQTEEQAKRPQDEAADEPTVASFDKPASQSEIVGEVSTEDMSDAASDTVSVISVEKTAADAVEEADIIPSTTTPEKGIKTTEKHDDAVSDSSEEVFENSAEDPVTVSNENVTEDHNADDEDGELDNSVTKTLTASASLDDSASDKSLEESDSELDDKPMAVPVVKIHGVADEESTPKPTVTSTETS